MIQQVNSITTLKHETTKQMSNSNPNQYFKEIQIPGQKHNKNLSFPFPSVLSPSSSSSSLSFIDSIKTHKPYLLSLLHKTGALLFRGFPVSTASDFNDVVEAFQLQEFLYDGAAPRTHVVGRVFTANESPPHRNIPFHHEMAQFPEFPSKLFFFCEVEPRNGGETPIVLSHVVYDRMKERYPDFIQQLEEHGLTYTRVLSEEDDPSSPIGRGWKSKFLTQDESVAEQRAAKLGIKLEWLEDGVKTVMGPIPGIKYDELRNRKIWFNNLIAARIGWQDVVTFGDGKPLADEIVHDCLKILEEESVAIPWQKGDVLLIDNWAVLHARNPCNPPRRILASLCK